MKNMLILKYPIKLLKRNIYIFLATSILFIIVTITQSLSKESVFSVNNVEIKGSLNINFSREKYLNKAFTKSFEILMKKILLKKDLEKIRGVKFNEIKDMISSFQIIEEGYSKDEYKIITKVLFNETEIKKFLRRKNISFSLPENIKAVFYPVLFIDGEIQNFENNFFYKNWEKIKIENKTIDFILPLEDLDDFSQIIKMKNNIERLNIDSFINKYDVENYVFALIEFQNKKLNIHLKINFSDKKISKNIFHEINDINEEDQLNFIIEDLKFMITDLWKAENLINLLMPLSIKIKFYHRNIENLDNLRNTIQKIGIVDSYTLEEFDVINSIFKIYYYGDPKKLKLELSKLGYRLENVQGSWQLYINE